MKEVVDVVENFGEYLVPERNATSVVAVVGVKSGRVIQYTRVEQPNVVVFAGS